MMTDYCYRLIVMASHRLLRSRLFSATIHDKASRSRFFLRNCLRFLDIFFYEYFLCLVDGRRDGCQVGAVMPPVWTSRQDDSCVASFTVKFQDGNDRHIEFRGLSISPDFKNAFAPNLVGRGITAIRR